MKPGLVYFLVCVGFVGLVVFSNHLQKKDSRLPRRTGLGRRLVVRKLSLDKHETVAFDPVVADLERKREDRSWEREYFQQQYQRWAQAENGTSGSHSDVSHSTLGTTHRPEHPTEEQHYSGTSNFESEPDSVPWDYMDPEDYLNNEDEFNISQRIVMLFPLIDDNPHDGMISREELEAWHLQAALKQAHYRTDRQMEVYDKNHDSLVSFSEYRSFVAPHYAENDTVEHDGSDWWKEQFHAADENGDGFLNHTEFNNFLHPQDSKIKKLLQLLCIQDIREHDHDHDGKLSFDEFSLGLFDIIRDYDEDEHALSHESNDYAKKRDTLARQKFTELDNDKDGFLMVDELLPVLDRLHPGESYYAKHQVEYLMEQADRNKDGHLTVDEMLESPYIFYSTAYAHDDDGYLHDEFR
eukprot:c20341_g1_i1 orf=235-1464(+)